MVGYSQRNIQYSTWPYIHYPCLRNHIRGTARNGDRRMGVRYDNHQYVHNCGYLDQDTVSTICHVCSGARANQGWHPSRTVRKTDVACNGPTLSRSPYRSISRAIVESAFLAWVFVLVWTVVADLLSSRSSGWATVADVAYSTLPPVMVSRCALIVSLAAADDFFLRCAKGISQCLIIIRLGWAKRRELVEKKLKPVDV